MCTNSFLVKRPSAKHDWTFQPVPCGRCPECVKARVNAWAFRISQELLVSSNPLFVTLTYRDDALTYADDGATLVKRDLQNFFKLLRYNYEKPYHDKFKKDGYCPIVKPYNRIRYYACGEYGTRFGRPHYHVLLLNLPEPLLVDASWNHGFNLSLPLRDGGVPYVLKYMAKPTLKTQGKQREFSLMSQGLGRNYLFNPDGSLKPVARFHYQSVDNCWVRADGTFKIPMPKYFKDKLYHDAAPITRSEVTSHLQARIPYSEQQQLEKFRLMFPDESEEILLRYILDSKRNRMFDKRINEVF